MEIEQLENCKRARTKLFLSENKIRQKIFTGFNLTIKLYQIYYIVLIYLTASRALAGELYV